MDFIAHLFLPRRSNNYRAKLLHHQVLLFFIAFLVSASILFVQVKRNFPQVLGTSTNITIDQLLSVTNDKRRANSLPPLNINAQLSTAAGNKANDMFAQNYWAHISPTGTTPWVFIKAAGYNYVYAGENLAKGFSTATDAVNAWMESPEHRENELSPNYQDVGFAVKTGKLKGEDTVLIVEEFGGKTLAQIPAETNVSSTGSGPVAAASSFKPIINSVLLSSNIYFATIVAFILLLVIDMWVMEKHKAPRIAGHNMDHILFLATILLAGMLIIKGVII